MAQTPAAYIQARIGGRVRQCLLDSGADVSLIPTQFVSNENLNRNERRLLAANNTAIHVDGQTHLPVVVGKQRLPSNLLASPNVDEVILGRDWLRQNNVTWNFANERVTINGVPCKLCTKNRENSHCKRCRVSTDAEIPPSGEAVIPTDVVFGNFRANTGQWTTVPSEPTPGLRVARTLITPDSPVAAVRVCNTSQRPIRLHRGQSMGMLQPVCSVSEPHPPTVEKATVTESLNTMLDQVDPSVPADAKQQLSQLMETYQDVFSYSEFDLGCTNIVNHEIDTGDNRPFKQPLRPQPRAHLPAIDHLLEEMQMQGIIQPCQSDWASNIVLVKKKDGSIRFCVDYRKLNDLTRKDAYPLPRIETCLDTLANAAWYSTFDLRSGFHQVAMRPSDANKTTFVCHRGTFRFPRMPFGLCNAPATFQRLMDTVLVGLNFEICLAYLDDIIVFSHDIQGHLERLEILFQRLREAHLKLKPSKCRILQRRVTFLGYTVSQAGVGTDPDKICAVRDWPIPQNLRQCRAFVGLCQYYRRFVPNFSGIAAPLHALTKKGARFIWSEECQAAFDQLKQILISADVLALPREEGTFILDCDASDKAIGAVLSQLQDGEERPICYASQLYDKHQQNYNVTRKELLALVTFVKKFRQYLLGAPFLIRTDHAALQWLKRTPEPIGQQARWLEVLEEFDFTIEHRPGSKHTNADALSRRIDQVTIADPDPSVDSAMNWPEAQRADPGLRFISDLVATNADRPTPESLASSSAEVKTLCNQLERLTLMSDGTLCRQFHRPGQPVILQKIVPPTLRLEVTDELHKGLNGGHLGTRRAKAHLQQRYYWPGWSSEVQRAKRRCAQCSRHQQPRPKHQAPLQPFLTGEPWERLGIDVTGPHPTSAKGNTYVLTVIDHFTKWVELFPMRNQEASTVAKLLVDRVFCVHGCPLQILTDRGTNFESNLFRELCELLAIDKIRTTAYQPSTNGGIERFHGTMHSMLAKWISANQRDWDEKLPAVAFAYRTSQHESTGFTPYFLMHGREARIPADIVYGPPQTEKGPENDLVSSQQHTLREAFELARLQLGKAASRRKHQYDLRSRPQKFTVGAQVWCLVPRLRPGRYRKWSSPYEGPFVVTRILGPVTYEIQRNPRSKPRVVHVDKLKPCWEGTGDPVNPSRDMDQVLDHPVTVRPRRVTRQPARYRH